MNRGCQASTYSIFAPDADPGDAELSALAGVLCEAIIERLLETGALRLISCNSTRAAAAANVQSASLAHLLGVDFALSGTLARDVQGMPFQRLG